MGTDRLRNYIDLVAPGEDEYYFPIQLVCPGFDLEHGEIRILHVTRDEVREIGYIPDRGKVPGIPEFNKIAHDVDINKLFIEIVASDIKMEISDELQEFLNNFEELYDNYIHIG